MKKIIDLLSEEMQAAFVAAGYDSDLGKVTLSNRPDLCEYQCNGAMAGAKRYKKAPIMIANDVAGKACRQQNIQRSKCDRSRFLKSEGKGKLCFRVFKRNGSK